MSKILKFQKDKVSVWWVTMVQPKFSPNGKYISFTSDVIFWERNRAFITIILCVKLKYLIIQKYLNYFNLG